MELVTTFAELRTRDLIRRTLGGTVERVNFVNPQVRDDLGSWELTSQQGVYEMHFANPSEPVILVYRPWPAGKTGSEVQLEVWYAAERYVNTGNNRDYKALREALENYEQGKPGSVYAVDPLIVSGVGRPSSV
ncbi:MAG TPA: hypothetical protein VD862_01650 [Candidatus Paceibacterota bacterium]|nr:hypothetical protein [Candidatus Paceibacterota bacterium]